MYKLVLPVLCWLGTGLHVQAQCPAAVALSIDTVITTESRCQASGTATVQAHGGITAYFYAITAGPVTVPLQSSSLFNSLPAGTYTVEVTDQCNTTLSRQFTVAGTYSVPLPVHSLIAPICDADSSGKITINVSNGRAPFSYALIAPSPVTTGPQTTNVFTGLPAGTYTYQVTDSCGNFQTRTVTLPASDNGLFYLQNGNYYYEDCDSFAIPYRIYPSAYRNFRPPYTISLGLPDGSKFYKELTQADMPATDYILYDTLHFRYKHTPGSSDLCTITAVNNCGATRSFVISLLLLDMYANAFALTDCSRQNEYAFDYLRDNSTTATNKLHCNTISYTLVSPSGVTLATQLNDSRFSGYPAGVGYKVVREDCCKRDTLVFNWTELPTLKITNHGFNPGVVCKEGTTSLNVTVNIAVTGKIVLVSGPPSVTFADGTIHTYTYPDTIPNQPFGSSGVNINYLTAGDYKIYAIDDCGQKDSLSFTVPVSALRHDVVEDSLEKGCAGFNTIPWMASSNSGMSSSFYYGRLELSGSTYSFPSSVHLLDSFVNVPTGNYTLKYTYFDYGFARTYAHDMSSYGCDVREKSIVVPAYSQPAFIAAPAVSVCSGDRNIALLPDSSAGVLPFRYQLTAGPVTTALQDNPVFTHLPQGTYTMLMADACNNSYSLSRTIDTLRLPSITTTGNSCEGAAATVTLPNYPYYSYAWVLPNGSGYNGNQLTIDPVTTADTGLYQITVTSQIGGCMDEQTTNARLDFCSMVVLPLKLSYWTGQQKGSTYLLHWKLPDLTTVRTFTVERSRDAIHFESIQLLPGGSAAYYYTDPQPLPGISWYRLKIKEASGHTWYSTLLTCNRMTTMGVTVTPRLVTGGQLVYISYPVSRQSIVVRVLNAQGILVRTVKTTTNTGQTALNLQGLPAGVYFVAVEGALSVFKVVKL